MFRHIAPFSGPPPAAPRPDGRVAVQLHRDPSGGWEERRRFVAEGVGNERYDPRFAGGPSRPAPPQPPTPTGPQRPRPRRYISETPPAPSRRESLRRDGRRRYDRPARRDAEDSDADHTSIPYRYTEEAVEFAAPPAHLRTAEPETIVIENAVYHQSSDDLGPSDDSISEAPVEEDSFKAYEEFGLALSDQSIADTSRDYDQSDLDSADLEELSAQKDVPGRQPSSRATRIFSSHFTGDAELGGTHGASLTVLPGARGRGQPLFRWLHLQQRVMSLDEFWADISRHVALNEDQRIAVTKLRADVQKNCVKAQMNSKGARVGYVEPKFVSVPIGPPKQRSQTTHSIDRPCSVQWVCIPYFALQAYSGLDAASSQSLFPPQTLLQAQYSRTTQQRDLDQAVCQLGAAAKGHCFHVAQIWCLILDDYFLVTCGTMSQAELQNDTLKISSEPTPEVSSVLAATTGRIVVSYGESVTWSFTTTECPDWFSFISRFGAFWPQKLQFEHRRQVVGPDAWSRILALASGPRALVSLAMKITSRPEVSPIRTLSQPEAQGEVGANSDNMPGAKSREPLHVLRLLQKKPKANDEISKALKGEYPRHLDEADKFLSEYASITARKVYKDCQSATRADVHAYLVSIAADVEKRNDDNIQREYEDRIELFNALETLYQLFLPIDCEGPTIGRFWSIVKKLVHMSLDRRATPDTKADSILTNLRNYLRPMVQDIESFQEIASHADKQQRAKMATPRQFVTAWLHVMSAMVYAKKPAYVFRKHLFRAGELLNDGMDEIIHGLSEIDLLDKAAVLPMEVLAFVSMGLLADRVGGGEDIGETYSQYLNLLDTDITTKPSDRSYQHRVNLVQQEMTVVKRTMAKQRVIVRGVMTALAYMEDSNNQKRTIVTGEPAVGYGRGREYSEERDGYAQPDLYYESVPYYRQENNYDSARPMPRYEFTGPDEQFVPELEAATRLSPTDKGGFRGLLFSECLRFVEQREFELRRYTEYAADLERAIIWKVDWTRDRQDNAVYAFTLVTIIFLPLSSIASIFGMNSSDVRDMDSGQWLYWSVALPVTLLIIVCGLWWTGELANVVDWLTGRRKRGASQGYPSTLMAASAQQGEASPQSAQYEGSGRRRPDQMDQVDGVYEVAVPASGVYEPEAGVFTQYMDHPTQSRRRYPPTPGVRF